MEGRQYRVDLIDHLNQILGEIILEILKYFQNKLLMIFWNFRIKLLKQIGFKFRGKRVLNSLERCKDNFQKKRFNEKKKRIKIICKYKRIGMNRLKRTKLISRIKLKIINLIR